MVEPRADNLTLPRMVWGTRATMDALGKPGVASPGMFVVNVDDDHLYQWVMDHWEGVGAWQSGGAADDPLANYQQGVQGFAFGGVATGGGGGTPAPRGPGDPSITDPMKTLSPSSYGITSTNAGATAVGAPVTVATLALNTPKPPVKGAFGTIEIPFSITADNNQWLIRIRLNTGAVLYQNTGGPFAGFVMNTLAIGPTGTGDVNSGPLVGATTMTLEVQAIAGPNNVVWSFGGGVASGLLMLLWGGF